MKLITNKLNEISYSKKVDRPEANQYIGNIKKQNKQWVAALFNVATTLNCQNTIFKSDSIDSKINNCTCRLLL